MIACSLASFARGHAATAQETRRADPDPQRFAAEIRAFEDYDRKNSTPPDSILFVGSSSIRLWPTAQSFPNLAVVNRGFGGCHASDVNHYAERIVLKYRPRTIVVYAGDNDIADGKSPVQVFEDIRSFVTLVHERLPKTKVVVLSIKPSVARWRLWPQMEQANTLVRQIDVLDDQMEYVDTSPPLLNNEGRPRADLLLADGLHLNEAGYRAWTQLLGPIISPPPAAK
ncbi:MAG: SGNH/GDSL hydrolase family protein [Pirellulales bacterium]